MHTQLQFLKHICRPFIFYFRSTAGAGIPAGITP